MEFLGLRVNYRSEVPELEENREYFSGDGITTHEVKVIDLGGTFADISKISSADRRLLGLVYHMAHKATAHLTLGAPHVGDPSIVHECVPVVDRLLRENLYKIVGEQPHEHS